MVKVSFFDKRIVKTFLEYTSAISTALSLVLIFVEIPADKKPWLGLIFVLLLFFIYLVLWWKSNTLEAVDIDVEGSTVTINTGDIFQQTGFKAIAFNEYFDTQVDDQIISKHSLNGIYINKYFPNVKKLDDHIEKYNFAADEIVGQNAQRPSGKKTKYSLGTICVHNDFLLTAFSKFDEQNRAWLSMPEYLSFLINFWDKVNKVYSQKNVSVPIFGSGITRIKEHRGISDEDLLKIMLWTFRISEMRFKYPAKLTIVIHKDKIDKINLLDIKSARNGL